MADPAIKDPGAPPDIAALSLLDKASQLQWMLQILSLTLFLDCALVLTRGQNVLTYAWEQFSWSASFGLIVVGVVAYSVLISVVIPIADVALGKMVETLHIAYPVFDSHDPHKYTRSQHQVTPYELHEYADRQQSDYALAKYKEYVANRERTSDTAAQLARLALQTFAFLITNVSLGASGSDSLFKHALMSLDVEWVTMVTLMAGILLTGLWLAYWCRSMPFGWIYFAPLYDEIEAKRRAERMRFEEHAER